MRTDSKKYSEDFIDSTKKFIINEYGEKYVNQNLVSLDDLENPKNIEALPKKKTVAEKRGIPKPQEAHEAIRPVKIHVKVVEDTNNKDNDTDKETNLHPKAHKLYKLIWNRTVESCMNSAQYNSVSAKIQAPLNTEFVYKTEQMIFAGWQIVENKSSKETNIYDYICSLKQNINMIYKKIESKFVLSELKSHYTEAKLVQMLEDKGIGRPSTFASLIDKIQERKYVEKQNITGKKMECVDIILENSKINEVVSLKEFGNEKNKLVIQPLGIIIIEFLVSKFDSFFNYVYTKKMEDELDLISKGEKIWNTLCDECYNELLKITDNLKDTKKFSIEIDKEHSIIIGKHGPVIKFTDSNNKKNVLFMPVKKGLDINELTNLDFVSLEDVIDDAKAPLDSIGKYKGLDLYVKKGKYGIYAQWGSNTKALKGLDGTIDTIKYIEVLKFLEKDKTLDPDNTVGLLRELSSNLSIRSSKYGDYIFYKKHGMKNPSFLKLKGFNGDYMKCSKDLIINWINQTYKLV